MGDLFVLPEAEEVSFVSQLVLAAMGGLYGVDVSIGNAAFGGIQSIWTGLVALWNWVEGVFQNLWTLITSALRWLFHTLLPDLVRWINEIRAKITQWLQPLVNWIKLEKAWLDMVYNQIIKPMLNLIQRLRSLLVIFRLLHIGWATALDQWLAQLEGRISAAFLQARQDINTLANWVNYIIDPTGLYNIPLFLLSQLQTLPQVWAALAQIPNVAVGAATAQAQISMGQSGLKANAQAEINSAASGPTADQLTRYSAIMAMYSGDGYTV